MRAPGWQREKLDGVERGRGACGEKGIGFGRICSCRLRVWSGEKGEERGLRAAVLGVKRTVQFFASIAKDGTLATLHKWRKTQCLVTTKSRIVLAVKKRI